MAEDAALTSESNGTSLGVTLVLPSETLGLLRQHQPQTPKKQPKLTFLSKKPPGDSVDPTSDEEGDAPLVLVDSNSDPLDDWNEVLPLEGEVQPDTRETNLILEEPIDKDNNTTNCSDGDEWSVSPDPPPHMPVVVVNLQRLVGYIPNSETEIEQLEHQIHAALWYGSSDAAVSKTGGNPQEDNMEQVLDAAQHFDERVTELMQSGVAQHSTTQAEPSSHQVVVAYPEFLLTPRDGAAEEDNFAPRKVLATERIWKRLLKPHPIPVVASLLDQLRNCHRSLVWKYLMHRELVQLANDEDLANTRRQQAWALREWKMVKREHQLEQLYQVRETLELRLGMAVSTVRELENVRDQEAALELRRRRVLNIGDGGLEALDLNSTILAFPESHSWLGLEEEDDDYQDDQYGPSLISDNEEDEYDGGSDGSGYEAEGDVEDITSRGPDATVPTSSADTDPTVAAFPRRHDKARKAKVAKRRRRRLEEAAKEAEHQTKLDQAREEEGKVRELCTTTDLKMAQAILAALEKKMESVDELLEKLQEEVWADEEAQEKGQALVPGEEDQVESKEKEQLCLLDQVLAMILGSFPPPLASKNEDATELQVKHTQKLKAEHSKIVNEWKDYFGRLPPSLFQPGVSTNEMIADDLEGDRQSELRTTYGIKEQERDEWDAADSDDDKEPETVSECFAHPTQGPSVSPAPAPKPPRVGLRPGGKVLK